MVTGIMSVEKRTFLKNARLLLSATRSIFNNFKSKIFLTKKILNQSLNQISTQQKKSKLTEFWKTNIRYKSNMNTEIFSECFKYRNPSILLNSSFLCI